MSSLLEIETAARQLSPQERRQLLILIAQSLSAEKAELPSPRLFSPQQIREWIDRDDADFEKLREDR